MENKEQVEKKRIEVSVDGKSFPLRMPVKLKDELDMRADEMGTSRSEAIRILTAIGMNMFDKYNPTETNQTTNSNPIHEVILNHVEIGENSSKSPDEIADDIVESVNEEILELLFESENIEESKGEFYRV